MNDYYAYIPKISDIKQNIGKIFRFVHFADHLRKYYKFCIKPNFTYLYYVEDFTTNPQVSKEIMEIVKDRADQVSHVNRIGAITHSMNNQLK